MSNFPLKELIRWPKAYISGSELTHLLGGSVASRTGMIQRAVRKGVLLRLRRDFYLISPEIHSRKVDNFEVAQLLYGPSYISFESALSFHHWIPEGVTVTTSASTKRACEYSTPIGTFTYERVPTGSFSLGVHHESTPDDSFLIAHPWKALADLIYTRRTSWPSLGGLMEDLRIEPESIEAADLSLLKELASNYESPRTRKQLTIFSKEISE